MLPLYQNKFIDYQCFRCNLFVFVFFFINQMKHLLIGRIRALNYKICNTLQIEMNIKIHQIGLTGQSFLYEENHFNSTEKNRHSLGVIWLFGEKRKINKKPLTHSFVQSTSLPSTNNCKTVNKWTAWHDVPSTWCTSTYTLKNEHSKFYSSVASCVFNGVRDLIFTFVFAYQTFCLRSLTKNYVIFMAL